jgi:hypothetical protein
VIPLAVAIGGAVLLVAGGVVGGLELAQVNALTTECGGSYAQCSPSATNAQADYDRTVSLAVTADVLMGVGVIAMVGGAVAWIVGRGRSEHASAGGVHVGILRNGIVAGGTF